MRVSRRPRPDLPHEEYARRAALPKPQYRDETEPVDTTPLVYRKIHPERDEAFLRWLHWQPCAIADRIDADTGQKHECWHPIMTGRTRYASDPAHTGKAYSGRVKRSDHGAIPLCRHAHRLQEDRMDDFDRRYGINRHQLATDLYARFCDEKGRAL